MLSPFLLMLAVFKQTRPAEVKSQTVNKGRPGSRLYIIQYVTYIVQLSVKTNSIIQYIYNRRICWLYVTKHVHSAKREGDYDTDIRVHSSHMMTKGGASGWCCLSPNHIRVRLLIFFFLLLFIFMLLFLSASSWQQFLMS